MLFKEKTPEELLKAFMLEHFDFNSLLKVGFFKKEMRKDYKAQADRICWFFGYKSVYEYGTESFRCHVSYAGERPLHVGKNGNLHSEPFVTVVESWFEDWSKE